MPLTAPIWVAPGGIEYMGCSVRTERYRHGTWVSRDTRELVARELYDHETDPAETENLAGRPAHAERLAELERIRLAGWRAARPEPY